MNGDCGFLKTSEMQPAETEAFAYEMELFWQSWSGKLEIHFTV